MPLYVWFCLKRLKKVFFWITAIINKSKDGAEDGSRVASSDNLCRFSYVLFVFLLFYVLDVVSITVYDRDTLLNIGSSVAQRKPDFEFLNAGGLFTDTASEPFVWNARPRRKKRSWKRGKRAAFLSDWDAVPFDLLSQPFCWLTFSHWITNSVNCVRASHTNEKQGMLRYLPHRNLDVCNGSRLSHRAYGLLRTPLG